MQREKSKFGIFITLTEPTKQMKEEANSAGFEVSPLGGEKIPRIEILTIKEIIEHKITPKVSQVYKVYESYKKAELNEEEGKSRSAKWIDKTQKKS
jgi:hypothetical protein